MNWTKYHPSLQKNFYQSLEAPQSIEDAKIKMQCHEHAVSDIEMQMDALTSEIDLEKRQEIPYNESKIDTLYERRIKLINAKRYHTNAANAYWFYMT
jgi:hypothetical protein